MNPLPNAKRPSLRWYLAYARLRFARATVGVSTPSLAGRLAALLCVPVVAVLSFHLDSPDTARTVTATGIVIVKQKAWAQIVWAVAMLIVSALITYALRPKPKNPEAVEFKAPVSDDGKSLRRIYGLIWIDDAEVLAAKQFPPIPIRASGGK